MMIYLVKSASSCIFLIRFAIDILRALLRRLVNILLNIFINLYISKYICTIPGNAEFHSSSVSRKHKVSLPNAVSQ